MGISCDLEIGSMDSETKPTCNRECLKLNGQDICNAVAETANTPLTIDLDANGANNSTSIIDLVSPTPQENESIILIGDDAGPEEGEIMDSEFEYEAISSDEEFTLRQQIEALEAKNRELEKIATISSRAIDFDYNQDYHRPSNYNNYKSLLVSNRSNIATKTNPPQLSAIGTNFKPLLPLSHVECISSDDNAHIIDNEPPYGFDGNSNSSKLYGRSHRQSSSSSLKKEKRQNHRRNKSRISDATSISDKEHRCLIHGKRRCTDVDCSIIELTKASMSRKKRTRYKYDCDRKAVKSKYSSDSEDELLRNREELKMALNIIDPSLRPANTTLLHKLSAIQNQQYTPSDDGKKSGTVKHRKRKTSHSPERESTKRSKHPKTNNNNNNNNKANTSKRSSKTEIDASESGQSGSANVKHKHQQEPQPQHNENDTHDDDDEQISLEEQELRLIALKSAVLKKHEARKRKQMASIQAYEQIARPYSPTDSIVLVTDETGGESVERGDVTAEQLLDGERSNDCQIDSDNNNMDISPISSPTNQYQPMDMDLVSSNENSNSPIFSYEKPQTFATPFDPFIDWGTVHIPVPINASTYVDIDQASATPLNQPFTLQPPYTLIYDANILTEPISSIDDDEPSTLPSDAEENVPNDTEAEELRAQLIQQMRGTIPAKEHNENGATEPVIVSNVDSLEEDCLRSLLLSSKGKKTNNCKESPHESHAKPQISSKSNKLNESKSCDDIPKLTLNLREALKRLKNNQQNKTIANSNEKILPNSSDANRSIDKTLNDENRNKHDCDHNENRKTVVNERIDNDQMREQNTSGQSSHHVMDVPSEAELTNETKPAIEHDGNTSNVSVKKTTTAAAKADALKSPSIVKASLQQKIATNISKEIPASKTIEQVVNKKESAKVLAKSATVIKPKQKPPVKSGSSPSTVTATAASVTTVQPLRPKSSTGSIASPTLNLNKMESIRRSSASPVITTWTAKPVKKLIISLNADSSSDTDDMEYSIPKKTDHHTHEPASNTFQVRLDQFLQTVRANTTVAVPDKGPSEEPNAIKKIATPPTTAAAATTSKLTTKKITTQKNPVGKNATSTSQSSSKLESSKAVAHLPISSQLEYHRLLNRMKLLEKQKEQKSRLKNQQPLSTLAAVAPTPTSIESNFENITVVIQNESRTIQTNRPVSMEESDKIQSTNLLNKGIKSAKLSVSKTPLITSNTSLAKKVLVKNATDTLNTPKSTDDLKQPSHDTAVKSVSSIQPKKNVPAAVSTLNSASDGKVGVAKAKPTAMSLAMFEKKTPKDRAIVLANYVKRYHAQGEQYLCDLAKLHRLTARTNEEAKKQKELEHSLDELRRQTKLVEENLLQQKALTQKYYPAISAAQKAANMNRIAMQKLENCCNRLGNIVNGSDYKVQSEKGTEIKKKIIQITLEKKKLKLLASNTAIPLQVPKSAAVKLPQKASTPSVTPSPAAKQQQLKVQPNSIAKQVSAVETEQKLDQVKCSTENSNDHKIDESNSVNVLSIVNSTIDEQQQCQSTPDELAPMQMEANAVEHSIEPLIQNSAGIEAKMDTADIQDKSDAIVELTNPAPSNHIHESTKSSDPLENAIETPQNSDDKSFNPADNVTKRAITNNGMDSDETQCGKYDSPLDHLENCVETQLSVSDADRNAIVCPYDLMGRCEDKQCQYKHITM